MHRFYGKTIALLAVTALLLCGVTACKDQPAVTPADVSAAAPADDTSAQPADLTSHASEAESLPHVSDPADAGTDASNAPVSAADPGYTPGYNTNLDMDDNVFMDALIYTGYNIKKHRDDGMMWIYILSADKRGMGYLSNITFGGGCTGLETTPDGKPDIKAFERGGLVCASFASYVYFNYLPNVAGIDTSSLTRPERTYNAHSFYTAAKDWIAKGYSHSIGFTATRGGEGIIFREEEEIPIGSIIVFEDDRKHDGMGSHITIYAGYRNGLHWVYQVGTKNGPEFCAVERMLFGPDPQWPLMVVSAPSNIRMSAALDVTARDKQGNPVAGAAVTVKTQDGAARALGKTDRNGKLTAQGLPYQKVELTQTTPAGYTCDRPVQTVTLTPKNNSLNAVTFSYRRTSPADGVTQSDRK